MGEVGVQGSDVNVHDDGVRREKVRGVPYDIEEVVGILDI